MSRSISLLIFSALAASAAGAGTAEWQEFGYNSSSFSTYLDGLNAKMPSAEKWTLPHIIRDLGNNTSYENGAQVTHKGVSCNVTAWTAWSTCSALSI